MSKKISNGMENEIVFRGYIPGAIGRVAELHAAYYAEHWGFGLFFEAKVASELSAFLSRAVPERDAFWTVCMENRVEGAIAIDGSEHDANIAHLRWFILSDLVRGQGIGNRLIGTALEFCGQKRFEEVYLWSFEGLNAARHLYEKHGFRIVEQREGKQWGTRVNEQKYILKFGGSIERRPE